MDGSNNKMAPEQEELSKQELINKIKEIIPEFKEYVNLINSINVFPIADKDTGTNIYLTLKKFLELNRFEGFGNSGNILEIFGNSLLNNLGEKFTIKQLTSAIKSAISEVEKSILNLKEGTIYTAMKRLYASLIQNKNLNEIIIGLYQQVLESKEYMKDYTNQDVVDSGALGFLIFLWLFNNKKPEINFKDLQKPIDKKDFEVYCINITCTDYEEEKIKTLDSVIIHKTHNEYKIHFHSPDLKSALEFNNPKILKITLPESNQKKTKICYFCENEEEKEFFSNLGLETVSSIEEIILKTNPLQTLYIIPERKKEILDLINLDAIIIQKSEEVLALLEVISLKTEFDKDEINNKLKKYALVENPSEEHEVIFKISRKVKEDSVYFPFLHCKEKFLVKKKDVS